MGLLNISVHDQLVTSISYYSPGDETQIFSGRVIHCRENVLEQELFGCMIF